MSGNTELFIEAIADTQEKAFHAGYMFVIESLRRMPKSMTLDDGLDRLEKLLEEG